MLKVFISSTCYQNGERRSLIKQAIEDLGLCPVMSDQPNFPVPSNMHSHDVCLEAINAVDIVVLILQKRYGQMYAGRNIEYNRISITHAEYRECLRRRKKIIVLAENDIHEQRHFWKKNPEDARVNIDGRVFDFFDEITRRPKDNWIHFFLDSFQCRDELTNRLAMIKNEEITRKRPSVFKNICGQKTLSTTDRRINELSIYSYWQIYCDSWDVVRKIWNLKIVNNTDKALHINGELPYPVTYPDPCILDYKYIVNNELASGDCVMRWITHPINSNCIIVSVDYDNGLRRGDSFEWKISFEHKEYFKLMDKSTRVCSGKINYLEHPRLQGFLMSQRVCKEYYISKSLLHNNGKEMAFFLRPENDWGKSNKKYWVFGYGRQYNSPGELSTVLMIKHPH